MLPNDPSLAADRAMRQAALFVLMVLLALTAGPLVLLGWPLGRVGKALMLAAIWLVKLVDAVRARLEGEG
jgi:hypothetical protein